MDINNQFDQELLSAYLDDGLTAEELGQVESWLAADPRATGYLNQLRSNRQTLKAMASLPGLTLRASMTDQVLAQIQATRPEPRRPDVHLPSTPAKPSSRNWWAWGAMAASAAAVAGLAILPMFPKQQPLSFVPPTSRPAETTLPVGTAVPSPVLSPDNVAAAPTIIGNVPLSAQVTPGGVSVDNSRRGPDERQGIDKMLVPQALLVGDILVTPAAWESGKFDQLLERYGIQYEKELIASASLIGALIESQVIAGPDAAANTQQDAALVYLDTSGEVLEKLFVEIENDRESFADLNYNLAIGGLGDTKADELLGALRAQTGSSHGRGVARLIMPEQVSLEKSKLLPGFDVTKKGADATLRQRAAAQVAGGGKAPISQQMIGLGGSQSESLIILRKN